MVKNKFFDEIHGNFGFGCMRLPMKNDEVDYDEFSKMIDTFINAGLNYFDTAHGYISGKSEIAIRDCLSSRYGRSQFLLTNKLTEPYFNKEEDIRPFFMEQLKNCGVSYFDFYLMHAQNARNYIKFKNCHAYEVASELKKEGYIRHLGISFHDTPETLDMILNEHPEIEIVQIQFNYADYDNPSVQSKEVYEVCIKHNKPVIVMEPVKGGTLVNLPIEADKVLKELNGGSNANYAIRFAASFNNMAMVLSGMSDMNQMNDNLSVMKDFKPLNEEEFKAINKVKEIFNSIQRIPCTGCRYCVDENHCPMKIRIPDIFATFNRFQNLHDWNSASYYNNSLTIDGNGKASACIKCGMCERVCPQHLPIRELLVKVKETFER